MVKLVGIFTVIVALQWKVIIKGMLENIPEVGKCRICISFN
jgi:hypothetical protein